MYLSPLKSIIMFIFLLLSVLKCLAGIFNEVENHNSIWKYDLLLDKYNVKQSGNFRLATIVVLRTGITYYIHILYHGISEQRSERNFKRKTKTTWQFMPSSITPLHFIVVVQLWIYLPCLLMIFKDKKRACYTPDTLADTLSNASGNSVSTFDNLFDPPKFILLRYDAPSTDHSIMRDKYGR